MRIFAYLLPTLLIGLSFTPFFDVFAQSNFTEGTAIGEAAKEGLPQYLAAVYRVGVILTVSLAVIVMMWGGLRWIMAGGNTSTIDYAKQMILGSVWGLVIALTSFVILNTINPQLVAFELAAPRGIEKSDTKTKTLCCLNSKDNLITFRANVGEECKDKHTTFIDTDCPEPAEKGKATRGSTCIFGGDQDCISECTSSSIRQGGGYTYLTCDSNDRCVLKSVTSKSRVPEGQCTNYDDL